jgi:hypothetical protein
MDNVTGNNKKRLGRTVKVLGLVSFFMDTSMEMVYPLSPLFLTSVLGAGLATRPTRSCS